MKKYKVTLSSMDCAYLEHYIGVFLNGSAPVDITNLLGVSALCEVLVSIKKKRVEYKREYKFTFSAVQAFGFCFLFSISNKRDHANSFYNRLLQINNEILQNYSVC
jgi:hypothetical protein